MQVARGRLNFARQMSHRVATGRNLRATVELSKAVWHRPRPICTCQLAEWRSEDPREVMLRIQEADGSYTYRGIQMVKDPFDIALYQMLVWRLRPRTIIEIGSKAGGSALMFADLQRNFDIDGRVQSFDVFPVESVSDSRVRFAYGDGQRLGDVIAAADIASWPRPWLVIEDADHSYQTSIAVLNFFDPHLAPGDWIVVEDGNLSHMYPEQYPAGASGPHRALREFLSSASGRYGIATELCDFFGYNATANSNGYLERLPG